MGNKTVHLSDNFITSQKLDINVNSLSDFSRQASFLHLDPNKTHKAQLFLNLINKSLASNEDDLNLRIPFSTKSFGQVFIDVFNKLDITNKSIKDELIDLEDLDSSTDKITYSRDTLNTNI
jgi:hypothetical protein